jgi:hypothetical protein
LIPPTVAGPVIPTPLSIATLLNALVWDSGTPSAMILEWNIFQRG